MLSVCVLRDMMYKLKIFNILTLNENDIDKEVR